MKTVFITGASRGIGRACALKFAENGYTVCANYYNNDEKAQSLKNGIEAKGGSCQLYKFDVSDAEKAKQAVENAVAVFGKIDVLINNAGISSYEFFDSLSEEEWTRTFDVNTKGAFNCAKYASVSMLHTHSGRIINISSVWGLVGASMEVHYSASKAALIGLTKALAKELGPSNITVNCICPGVIATDMNRVHSEETIEKLKEETPLMRIGEPEDVANLAFFLSEDEASFITGQVISVDGGFAI
jgi:3-oxoacyl-[acyl-carrier protein] reductase